MVRTWRSTPRMRWIRRVCVVLGSACLLAGAATGDPLAFDLGVFASGFLCLWSRYATSPYRSTSNVGAEAQRARSGRRRSSGGSGPTAWSATTCRGRYGNVDHLAVRPAAVFLLDSKAWFHGSASVTADGPVVASRHDVGLVWHWTRLPCHVRAAAAGARDGPRTLAGHRIYVTPVVVIWGGFPGKVQERGGVVMSRASTCTRG